MDKMVMDESNNCDTTLSIVEPVLSRIVDGVSGQNISMKLLKAQVVSV